MGLLLFWQSAADTTRRAQVSWAELEVPNAPRRAVVGWAEFEVPNAPRRGVVGWAEFEVPNAPAPRRAQVSWAELEVPNGPRRAQIGWAELEVPEYVGPQAAVLVGSGSITWADEVQTKFRKRHLEGRIRQAVREEKKLVQRQAKLTRTLKAERTQSHPVDGILAKYWQISEKIEAKRLEIKGFELELRTVVNFLNDDDEDDIEAILLDS